MGATERTYRLLLDELPETASPAGVSGLNFTIRFALPVFLPAATPQPRGAIEAVTLRDGKLSVTVRNTGNQHFRIASVAARSGEAFAAESGWYLLPGRPRSQLEVQSRPAAVFADSISRSRPTSCRSRRPDVESDVRAELVRIAARSLLAWRSGRDAAVRAARRRRSRWRPSPAPEPHTNR
jgi:hypothetical protein